MLVVKERERKNRYTYTLKMTVLKYGTLPTLGQRCQETNRLVREEYDDPKYRWPALVPRENRVAYASIRLQYIMQPAGAAAVMGAKNLRSGGGKGTRGVQVAPEMFPGPFHGCGKR